MREFIRRRKAYNKHDTGRAKGAPPEDYTTLPYVTRCVFAVFPLFKALCVETVNSHVAFQAQAEACRAGEHSDSW